MKKRKTKKASRIPLPMPAPQASKLEIPDVMEMICPNCHTHWGNAHIEFGKPMKKEHFSILEDLKSKMVFQKSGLPNCPSCGFEYTPYAIYALMISAVARKKMEGNTWKTQWKDRDSGNRIIQP